MGWAKIKKSSPETIAHKQFETNSNFMWNSTQQEKFKFCFSRVFCSY